jgi:hypothetical protein
VDQVFYLDYSRFKILAGISQFLPSVLSEDHQHPPAKQHQLPHCA